MPRRSPSRLCGRGTTRVALVAWRGLFVHRRLAGSCWGLLTGHIFLRVLFVFVALLDGLLWLPMPAPQGWWAAQTWSSSGSSWVCLA